MHAYSDTLFIPNESDKALLSARFSKQGTSWEDEILRRPKYVWARCRRPIPPPEVLHPLLSKLFETFGPLKDAKAGSPLFNAEGWKAAMLLIKDLQEGFVSDPPDVALYSVLGICGGSDGTLRDGVNIYQCCRGTNATEGGVHQNIRRRFPTSGVSVRHAVAHLLDYRLMHSLIVSSFLFFFLILE